MEINVPTSWNDVTVSKYQAFSLINKDDYKTDLSYLTAVLQVLCDVDNMSTLPLSALNEIVPLIDFLQSQPPKEQYDSVVIDGQLYEWISSFNAITVGEAISYELPIDLEELSVTMAYDVILAVLLRKKDCKFDADQFNDNRIKFAELPVTEVLGKLLFFLNGEQTSTVHTKTYSIIPMTTTISQRKNLTLWQKMKTLAIRISGYQLLTSCLRAILRSMKKYTK